MVYRLELLGLDGEIDLKPLLALLSLATIKSLVDNKEPVITSTNAWVAYTEQQMTTYHNKKGSSTMRFEHTPASTINTPDIFVDPRIDETYRVSQDEFASDPRDNIEDTHVALYCFAGPRGHRDEVPDNRIAEGFAHFYETFGESDKALAANRRWIKIYYPEIMDIVAIDVVSAYGYSQGDWYNIFAVVTLGYGSITSHVDEFRQWAFGDVWVVSSDDEALNGIYADSPEEAVEQFIETNPPAYDNLIFDNELAQAIADALRDRGDETAARSLHANEELLGGENPEINIGEFLDRVQSTLGTQL